jgi:hypothetical protein
VRSRRLTFSGGRPSACAFNEVCLSDVARPQQQLQHGMRLGVLRISL